MENNPRLMNPVLLNAKQNAVLQRLMDPKVIIALQIAQNHVIILKKMQSKQTIVILNVLNRAVQTIKKRLALQTVKKHVALLMKNRSKLIVVMQIV